MDDEAPLDETVWTLPEEYRPWFEGINANHGWQPGVNAENVHVYFTESHFCEASSSNRAFQHDTNYADASPELIAAYFDRKRFHANLATRSGVEYVVVDGPERSTPDMNPVWVIRRQLRVKNRQGGDDDVTPTGTFFVVGERVYQAPSLADMLQARITKIQLQLSKFHQTAAALQYYSPEKGYSYFPSFQKPKANAGLESTRTSRAGSPMADTASQSSARQITKESLARQDDDDSAIFRSFELAMRFGNEHMDENPLVGEPGSFKLSTTNRNIRDKHTKETAAEAVKEAAKLEAESRAASVAPTSVPPIKTANLEKRGSGSGKSKSPTSATGEGIKKRRKSKAPGTPGSAVSTKSPT